MIDLHIHLLPGVDDGPAHLDEAVEMCRRAAEDGCTTLVTTPHQRHDRWWNSETSDLERLRARLQDALGGEPRVLLGAEVRVGEGLLEDLDRGRQGGVLTLAGSRYLLLEFSRIVPDPDPAGLVHELVVGGWRPLLAHLEEIRWLADDLGLVERLVAKGAAVQMTGASILGHYGRSTQERARRLLDAGLVHVMASDAHDATYRRPGLREARDAVARRYGEDLAERLTEVNPAAVIADRALPGLAAAEAAASSRPASDLRPLRTTRLLAK